MISYAGLTGRYLLLNVLKVRVEQLYEDWHGSSLDHRLGLQGRARCYVGQRPGCFELWGHRVSLRRCVTVNSFFEGLFVKAHL